jgi:hypothetical protein
MIHGSELKVSKPHATYTTLSAEKGKAKVGMPMPTLTTPRPCLHGYTTISFDVFTSISGGGHGWGRNGLGMACDASPLISHEF